jgi:glycosyltransferase involved in cell wall biosynthesis
MFLIEAMSYGVPVITTDVGGNIEIINDGINGFQIENNNIKENLNNVLRIVSKDLPISKKLRNSALATIEENHSTKKMVALFQDFLKKV